MAGIYVPGMEMPNNCTVCELATHYERFGNEDYCPFLGWYSDYEKCPLVPVPDHGELIDLSTVDLADGPYEYSDWVEWALHQYLDAPLFLPADRKEGKT